MTSKMKNSQGDGKGNELVEIKTETPTRLALRLFFITVQRINKNQGVERKYTEEERALFP